MVEKLANNPIVRDLHEATNSVGLSLDMALSAALVAAISDHPVRDVGILLLIHYLVKVDKCICDSKERAY